jgi:hypothetical protein
MNAGQLISAISYGGARVQFSCLRDRRSSSFSCNGREANPDVGKAQAPAVGGPRTPPMHQFVSPTSHQSARGGDCVYVSMRVRRWQNCVGLASMSGPDVNAKGGGGRNLTWDPQSESRYRLRLR